MQYYIGFLKESQQVLSLGLSCADICSVKAASMRVARAPSSADKENVLRERLTKLPNGHLRARELNSKKLRVQLRRSTRIEMKSTLSGLVKDVGDAFTTAADVTSTVVDKSLAAVKESAEKAGQSALEFRKSAGDAIGDAAQATSSVASKAGGVIAENASKSFAVVTHGAKVVGESTSAGAKSAGMVLTTAADSAGNALGALGVLVGDLNGDGKVDFEDAKIAAAKVRNVAGVAAEELGQLGKTTLQSKLVQDAAAGAVVGGVLASMIPIPIISTVTGATVGAAVGAYKSIGKK